MNTETTDQNLRRLIRLALEEIKGEADLMALKNTASYSIEDAKADAEEARNRDAEFAKSLQVAARPTISREAYIDARNDCRTLGRELRDAEATIASLKADADGSAQTVAALRKELEDAEARLAGIAEVLRKPICFPMGENTRETVVSILYRNSI